MTFLGGQEMEPAMTQAARVSTEVNATPDEVWEVLTDPDKLSKLFFGAQVSTDWQVGHPIRWTGEWEEIGRAHV